MRLPQILSLAKHRRVDACGTCLEPIFRHKLSTATTRMLSNKQCKVLNFDAVQVDVKNVLSTNLYASRDAEAQAQPYTPPPDNKDDSDSDDGTLEHAVTSFVYESRMPFHPGRLHMFISRYSAPTEPYATVLHM